MDLNFKIKLPVKDEWYHEVVALRSFLDRLIYNYEVQQTKTRFTPEEPPPVVPERILDQIKKVKEKPPRKKKVIDDEILQEE